MMKVFERFRQNWLRWLVVGVSVLGIPLAFLTGSGLVRLESKALDFASFRKNSDEIAAFTRIYLRGNMDVKIVCSEQFRVEVADREDEIYFFQRTDERLRIAGQQTSVAEPFSLVIHTPEPITFVEMRRSAKIELPPCAVNSSQLTADLAADSIMEVSGSTVLLYLFGAGGSRFVEGVSGPLTVRKAFVDMVLGAKADLCGIDEIEGSGSLKGVIRVKEDAYVKGMHEGLIDRSCT